MSKLKNISLFLLLASITFSINARKSKVNHLEIAQDLINQAYKMGYVDAAPIEMSNIDNKMKDARFANEKRKRKDVEKLTAQIKADLKIVKKRYEVNKQHQQLSKAQSLNLESKKILDDLRSQL